MLQRSSTFSWRALPRWLALIKQRPKPSNLDNILAMLQRIKRTTPLLEPCKYLIYHSLLCRKICKVASISKEDLEVFKDAYPKWYEYVMSEYINDKIEMLKDLEYFKIKRIKNPNIEYQVTEDLIKFYREDGNEISRGKIAKIFTDMMKSGFKSKFSHVRNILKKKTKGSLKKLENEPANPEEKPIVEQTASDSQVSTNQPSPLKKLATLVSKHKTQIGLKADKDSQPREDAEDKKRKSVVEFNKFLQKNNPGLSQMPLKETSVWNRLKSKVNIAGKKGNKL